MNPHTQHPQRCETCNHNKKSSITGILVNCTFHEITLSDSDTDLICVIGCASHSEQEIQVPDCPYHQYQCAWDGNPEQHYCKRDEKLILRLKEERQEEREGVLVELAEFLDNTDNTSDSGNAQKWVSLPVLFKWMQSKGWRP